MAAIDETLLRATEAVENQLHEVDRVLDVLAKSSAAMRAASQAYVDGVEALSEAMVPLVGLVGDIRSSLTQIGYPDDELE